MAILRVHKKQNKTVETPNTPNATTQSGTSRRLMHLLDIFRTHLTTAEEVDELVRAIISEQTTKHLAAFYRLYDSGGRAIENAINVTT